MATAVHLKLKIWHIFAEQRGEDVLESFIAYWVWLADE
jgi:hypothetical protein